LSEDVLIHNKNLPKEGVVFDCNAPQTFSHLDILTLVGIKTRFTFVLPTTKNTAVLNITITVMKVYMNSLSMASGGTQAARKRK
jgi:hypothetical protein